MYVVVSPVRDEAQYLETTIRSMIQQTVKPTQWILVDDGSTDRTAQIIRQYALDYPWITLFQRPGSNRGRAVTSRGDRACEAKEIQAFYAGLPEVSARDWEFLVKMDGDVAFEPDYFQRCFSEFESDQKLGIGGGNISNLVEGKLQPEPAPRFHVRGATKIYRRKCWEEIGGIARAAGWDTLDEVKANMLGWQTRTFPGLTMVHLRYTGAANGAWKNAYKNGLWSYTVGYHPLYLVIRCANRVFKRPCVIGSVGLLCGYMTGFFRRVPHTESQELVRYLRNQQLRRICCRESIWE